MAEGDKVVRASFQNLRTMEKLTLEYNPDEVNEGRTLHTEDSVVPGVSHSTISIGAGSDDPITFTIRLARTLALQPIDYVKKQVAWLKALTFPYEGDTPIGLSWSAVQFKWGELYDLPCIIKQCRAKFISFNGPTAQPDVADVELTLQPISLRSIPAPDVISNDYSFVRYL